MPFQTSKRHQGIELLVVLFKNKAIRFIASLIVAGTVSVQHSVLLAEKEIFKQFILFNTSKSSLIRTLVPTVTASTNISETTKEPEIDKSLGIIIPAELEIWFSLMVILAINHSSFGRDAFSFSNALAFDLFFVCSTCEGLI